MLRNSVLDVKSHDAAISLYEALSFFVEAIARRAPGWEDLSDLMRSTPEQTAWDDGLQAMAKWRDCPVGTEDRREGMAYTVNQRTP